MAKKKAKGGEMLIVQSKAKEYIKSKKMMSSSDFFEALNGEVHLLIDKAIERCKANKRATVSAKDV